jgi:Leucine-rich repeat (LRR) protein
MSHHKIALSFLREYLYENLCQKVCEYAEFYNDVDRLNILSKIQGWKYFRDHPELHDPARFYAILYLPLHTISHSYLEDRDYDIHLYGFEQIKKLEIDTIYGNPHIHIHDCPKLQVFKAVKGGVESLKLGLNLQQLTELDCETNNITELDLTHLSQLEYLNCSDCRIEKLTFPEHFQIESINCNSNELKKITFPKNSTLETLVCSYNPIEELDIQHCYKLSGIHCENTEIVQLNIPESCSVEYLDCGSSALHKLEISNHPTLKNISIFDSSIKTLDISNCIRLKTILWYDTPLEKLIKKHCPKLRSIGGCMEHLKIYD